MGDFKGLKVWSEAHSLALDLYRRTTSFPPVERYGLTSQIRRAASSIGANLAEGCGRRSERELARFVRIARGSAHELEYHLMLAKDLGLLSEAEWRAFDRRVQEVAKMLTGLLHAPPPHSRL